MPEIQLRDGWLIRSIMTFIIVGLGLHLIKRGAKNLYKFYSERGRSGEKPIVRTLIIGIAQVSGGVVLLLSFLLSSPFAINLDFLNN